MSIKSDLWIKRMCRERGLISPYEEKLVRRVDDRRIISAGLSSYGYDCRLARDEFKVFSPVTGTEIDPKNFDPHSLLDVPIRRCEDGSEYWLLPPHSYALGVTIERFSIPRNVTALAIGKCVTGDSRVINTETGELVELREFVRRRMARTATLDDGRIGTADVLDHLSSGVKPVYWVRTRTGRKIKLTSNHPLLTFDGWTPVEELVPGHSRIAVPRVLPFFGISDMSDHEADLLGLMISDGQCNNPGPSPCYTSAMGVNVSSRNKFVPARVFASPRRSVARFLRALFSGDGSVRTQDEQVVIEYSSMSERLIEDVQHLLLRFGIISSIRSKQTDFGTTAWRLWITDKGSISTFAREIGLIPGSQKHRRLEEALSVLESYPKAHANIDTLPSQARVSVKAACERHNCSMQGSGFRSKYTQGVSQAMAARIGYELQDQSLIKIASSDVLWDRVESIEYAGEEEVYDLSICGTHNFVSNDIVVHNSTYARCGLIANTTPLEADWCGRLVVELYNAANLPVRLYAEEGFIQILFFESDENCETSYSDRGGKYQDQPGLTLAKV